MFGDAFQSGSAFVDWLDRIKADPAEIDHTRSRIETLLGDGGFAERVKAGLARRARCREAAAEAAARCAGKASGAPAGDGPGRAASRACDGPAPARIAAPLWLRAFVADEDGALSLTGRRPDLCHGADHVPRAAFAPAGSARA